jgi:predicted membrane-bound spermidine synthase
MPANLIYLAATVIAIIVLAKAAPTTALLAAAFALIAVLAVLATLSQGPAALTSVIDALARLFHGDPSG